MQKIEWPVPQAFLSFYKFMENAMPALLFRAAMRLRLSPCLLNHETVVGPYLTSNIGRKTRSSLRAILAPKGISNSRPNSKSDRPR